MEYTSEFADLDKITPAEDLRIQAVQFALDFSDRLTVAGTFVGASVSPEDALLALAERIYQFIVQDQDDKEAEAEDTPDDDFPF